MEKLWEPVDRVLSNIGRFVLLRPGASGLFLLSVISFTLWSNGFFKSSDSDSPLVFSNAVIDISPVVEETILSELSDVNPVEKETPFAPHSYVMQIMSGDTLSNIFQRYDVSVGEALTVSKLENAKLLKKLKLGQEMRLLVNADNTLKELVYAIDKDNTLTIQQTNTGFEAKQTTKPISEMAFKSESNQEQVTSIATLDPKTNSATDGGVIENKALPIPEATKKIAIKTTDEIPQAEKSNDGSIAYVSGEITHSLYVDARKAGLSVKQADQLGKIFSINGLAKKLRKGDRFSVLYEKTPKNSDQKERNILLAQLSHKGETYQAIRFTDPKGKTAYFNPEGKSLQPAISRIPVPNARVSSGFSKGRMHPVLHVRRPHLGVDYAAPTGTPIKAAGDGVVAYRGYKGGYGNTVTIKHDGKYTTLYAHMSRFAKNVNKGTVVKEGQIIGYVGSTGIVTGSHLHYEVHVNNTAQNPLTVALPGISVPAAYKSKFLAEAKTLLAQLQLNQGTQFAKSKEGKPSVAS